MLNIKNAIITDTFLGREDHGIFTFYLGVEISERGFCNIGGYALDYYDKESDKRKFKPESLELISKILDVVGVDSFEKLKGAYIRVEDAGFGKSVSVIGNLMEDKWIAFENFFAQAKHL